MPPELFLHQRDDFEDLIRIVSEKLAINPYLVEKDYWIMHCLWGLQRQFHFELKGGTSLSKGFRIIDRFSEDLDIRIDPPAGRDVKTGRNQNKLVHVESRRSYFDWLSSVVEISDIVAVERDTDFDDDRFRSAGIRLRYEAKFPAIPDVREGVLLEAGFDDTAPNEAMDISSWALDHALEQDVPFADNRARGVTCYSPAYTFVEKLQTVSTKFRRQQETGDPRPASFLRHYYDVYQLLGRSEVLEFIGTAEYQKRKKVRFRSGDNPHISENEAFLLQDNATRAYYQEEYEGTTTLYYKGQVPFDRILQRIADNLDPL